MKPLGGRVRKWIQAVWFSLLAMGWPLAHAGVCDMSWDYRLYGANQRPVHDYADFLGGNLGIITGALDSAYLYVAWRRMQGYEIPKSAIPALTEQYACTNKLPSQEYEASKALTEAIKDWKASRAALNMPERKIGVNEFYEGYRLHDQIDYPTYLNCNAQSFKHAAETFKSRAQQYSGDKTSLKEWVEAQDRTFANCQRPAELPMDVSSSAPVWLRHDRAYQRAAALFYMGRYSDAVSAFDAIAADRSSPWRTLAAYLAARALIREGTKDRTTAAKSAEAFSDATKRLTAIIDDPALSDQHVPASRMLTFVRARTEPLTRFRELDASLSAKASPNDLVRSLIDHGALMWKLKDELGSTAADEYSFTAWIYALRGSGAPLERWKSSGSTIWLIAALSQSTGNGPEVSSLLSAAAAIQDDSPAAPTIRYHEARLQFALGRPTEARKALQRLERMDAKRLPAPSSNLVKELKLPHARNLTEWLAAAVRTPDPRLGGKPIHLDEDGVSDINFGLPLDSLARLSRKAGLPANLKEELIVIAFTRAVLLDRPAVARDIAPRLREYIPGAEGRLNRYLAASDSYERRAKGALLLAVLPGLIIDTSSKLDLGQRREEFALPYMRRQYGVEQARLNWWCKEWSGRDKSGAIPIKFLTRKEREKLEIEQRALNTLTNGTDNLMKPVLAWAKTAPQDPDLPQALHMLVRSSRGGCTTRATPKYSILAFRHLHTHFKQDPWTEKTRYHYGYTWPD